MPVTISVSDSSTWKSKNQKCYLCHRVLATKGTMRQLAPKGMTRWVVFCSRAHFVDYLQGFADYHLQKYLAEHGIQKTAPDQKNKNSEIPENTGDNPNILCQNCPKYKEMIVNYIPEQTRRILYEAGP